MSVAAGPHPAGIRSPRVRAARQLGKRALRQRARSFLVEGPQSVAEALASDARLTELFVTAEGSARHAGLADRARRQGADVHLVSGEVMAQPGTDRHSAGRARRLRVHRRAAGRADRGAAGTGGRARARARPGQRGHGAAHGRRRGAHGVVFSTASVDPYNGKCVRATAGSLFHLPVVAGVSLAEAAASLRAAGLRVLAADGRGRRSLDELADAGELSGPTAWLFGNEAWGLPDDLLALADETVAVPIYGRAESLNLAAAAAVCLYGSARAQRRG